MGHSRGIAVWGGILLATLAPLGLAAASPLLAWRDTVYIAAGFAGIIGLCLLLVQPLLACGWAPGLAPARRRALHRWTGGALVACVVGHVAGLWITSPPDVVDVLLFRSPTPFSVWGAIAMWALFATALLASSRRRLRLRPRMWRLLHLALAVVIAAGTAAHAMLIEGAMEPISKAALCALVAIAVALAARRRLWGASGGRI